MELNTLLLIGVVLGLVVGFIGNKLIERYRSSKQIEDSKLESKRILEIAKQESENLKKNKIIQAKEKFLELKAEHEKIIFSRENKIKSIEREILDKEKEISSQLSQQKDLNAQLKSNSVDYEKKLEVLEKRTSELDKARKEQIKQLEIIAGLSEENAKNQLIDFIKKDAEADALVYVKEKMEEAEMTVQQDAKKIIIDTIQRIGAEETIDNTVSVFHIESDDLKGRIIGREGRNIKALESATGVEIIVDDTPEAIILSCFDSIRREIARMALHKLVKDGRIHPARIEDVVKKTEKQIEQEIIEVGKRTVIDLGIHGLHPELIRIIGRMKYRSS